MSRVEDLEPQLKYLESIKPPGASKSTIASITQICIDNIRSDTPIVQKLFSHFKRTSATHKLGVLYVIDSITRQWIEKARQSGQELAGIASPDGTYASGVYKVTELMPSLMDEAIRVAPQDQKAKLEGLVNIWERGNTFPAKMVADFKLKFKSAAVAAPIHAVPSKTPPGSPPQGLLSALGIPRPVAAQQPDAASVLRSLQTLGNQSQQPALAPPPPTTTGPPVQDLSALLSSLGQPPAQAVPTPLQQMPQFAPPVPPPQGGLPPQFAALFPGAAPPPPPQFAQPPPAPPNAIAALSALIPPHILGNPEQLTRVLQLFGELMKGGIPQEQWGPVVAALYPNPQAAPPATVPAAAPTPSWQPPTQQEGYSSRADRFESAYGNGFGGGRRDRSRSPDQRRDRVGRRPSPVYGTYDSSARDADGSVDDGRGGRRQGSGRFRQRSPAGVRDEDAAPNRNFRPKWTDIDPTLAPGHIKVLSRTLFVGGASGNESDLRAIFGRFGPVQTCIVNNDKRHAFVKMCNRQDAVQARDTMESTRDPDILSKARQTKWGVGFGPRECCDYSTGVSTIPIDTLTEADMKWVLTAEFGGTGGRQIESGLVFEEPDIEIGAGVSSKAMSRRVMPDTGRRGGRGGGGGGDGGRQRYRQPEPRYESPRPEPMNVQPPPPVPNFGFQFALPGQGAPQYR